MQWDADDSSPDSGVSAYQGDEGTENLPLFVSLPAGLEFLMSQLILDGCLVKVPQQETNGTFTISGSFGASLSPVTEVYALTASGMELVERLIAAKPLE